MVAHVCSHWRFQKERDKSRRNRNAEPDIKKKTAKIHTLLPQIDYIPLFCGGMPYAEQGNHQLQKSTSYNIHIKQHSTQDNLNISYEKSRRAPLSPFLFRPWLLHTGVPWWCSICQLRIYRWTAQSGQWCPPQLVAEKHVDSAEAPLLLTFIFSWMDF